MSGATDIRVKQLRQHYGTVRALDEVNLHIKAGEMFFLLGPSGCGKTTLLRSLAGLHQAQSGEIWFGDENVTRRPAHQRACAMVFQNYALWPHLSVAKNVSFGLEQMKLKPAEIRDRVEEILDKVQLGAQAERAIDALSGGQQQRVALARALVVRPKCLLLDEPLSNLDAALRMEMRMEIRRIVKEYGVTAVYVTHDQEEAFSMADRIGVMEAGRLIQTGSPQEIYTRPATLGMAKFLGELSHFSAEVVEIQGRQVKWRASFGEIKIEMEARGLDVGARGVVAVRPEAVRLSDCGERQASAIQGEVFEIQYLGARVRYGICMIGGERLWAEENHVSQLRELGEKIQIEIEAEDWRHFAS